jgi:predicted NUDIX family phosphoesterase
MAQEEQVLVIERSVLEETGMFQGLAFDTERRLERFFAPGTPRFMPRSQAENDPSFKQLIPYVILSCNGKYLSYVRGKRAGETRLVGNRSLGIGGHINPVDDMALFGDFRETYLNAVKREVEEEIHVKAHYTDRIVALINDDSNAVGAVHLGVVHLWTLDSDAVDKREQMITQMGFMTPEALLAERDAMETWSQLCLDALTTPGCVVL